MSGAFGGMAGKLSTAGIVSCIKVDILSELMTGFPERVLQETRVGSSHFVKFGLRNGHTVTSAVFCWSQ